MVTKMPNMREGILRAIRGKLSADISNYDTNLEVLLLNSVGIGEHSDIVLEADKWITIVANAEEKLAVLEKSMPLTDTRHSEFEEVD